MTGHPGDPLAIANYNQRLTTALRLLRRRVKTVADTLEQSANDIASKQPRVADQVRACARELNEAEVDARTVRREAPQGASVERRAADGDDGRAEPGRTAPPLENVIETLRRRT